MSGGCNPPSEAIQATEIEIRDKEQEHRLGNRDQEQKSGTKNRNRDQDSRRLNGSTDCFTG